MSTQLYIKSINQFIDVDEKYGISTAGNVQDIRDLGKVSPSASKSIVLTGNKNINKIFNSIFNINTQTLLFDRTIKQECELIRNSEVIIIGYFQIDNINYISKYNYEYEITIFDEQTNFFIEIEENLLVGNPDSSKDINLSQWNHIWNHTNIIDSWDKGPDDIPYFYPMFDYTEGFWAKVENFKPAIYVKSLIDLIFIKYGYQLQSEFMNTDLFKALVIPFSMDKSFPSIDETERLRRKFIANIPDVEVRYIRHIMRGLMNTRTFGYSANFGTTWVNIPGINGFETGQNLQNFPDSSAVIKSMWAPFNIQTSGEVQLYDGYATGANLNTISDICKFTPDASGKHDINVKIPFKLYLENNSGFNSEVITTSSTPNNIKIKVDVMKIVNGSTLLDIRNTSITNTQSAIVVGSVIKQLNVVWPNLNNGASTTITSNIEQSFNNLQLSNGSSYFIRVIPIGMGYKNPLTNKLVDVKGEFSMGNYTDNYIKNNPLLGTVSEGATLNLNDFLLPKFKQKDLFTSLNTMFNLCWMPDPFNSKTLIIEPRDDFYASGDIYNLDNNPNFYITDKPSKFKLVSEFQAKEHIFSYLSDAKDGETKPETIGNTMAQDYEDIFKRVYGEQRAIFNNDNLNGVKKYDIKFASSILGLQNITTTGTVPYPNNITAPRRYLTSIIFTEEPKTKPRILFKNVIGFYI